VHLQTDASTTAIPKADISCIVIPNLFLDPSALLSHGKLALRQWIPDQACPEPVEGSGMTNVEVGKRPSADIDSFVSHHHEQT
jgi:hypothetical protein